MSRRAATAWFSKLADVSVEIIHDFDHVNNVDLLAIEFHDSNYNGHLEVIERLQSQVKKFLVVESEPTTTQYQGFVEYLDQLPDNVVVFSDTVICSPRKNCRTAISWFVTNNNYYQPSIWPHQEEWRQNMFSAVDQAAFRDRKYLFDCLLGTQKPHRDLINLLWETSELRDRFFYSYIKNDMDLGYWPPGVDRREATSVGLTAGLIKHDSMKLPLSAILPFDIYNQSYYSIVCETTCENTYSHFTEKVAKPIIARRPFVVFAGQHYLKNLKSLGFQTFHRIVDEGYDNISDRDQRFKAAWHQVEQLCLKDPEVVYATVQAVLDYNRQHFLNTDWYSGIKQALK